jgi:hypothetical protein
VDVPRIGLTVEGLEYVLKNLRQRGVMLLEPQLQSEVRYLLRQSLPRLVGFRSRPFCATPRPWNMSSMLNLMLSKEQIYFLLYAQRCHTECGD